MPNGLVREIWEVGSVMTQKLRKSGYVGIVCVALNLAIPLDYNLYTHLQKCPKRTNFTTIKAPHLFLSINSFWSILLRFILTQFNSFKKKLNLITFKSFIFGITQHILDDWSVKGVKGVI